MIKRAIFTNSFGTLISRILGFFRDLLMASTLGASIYSDIFLVAFKLPNLFRRVFAEGAFTQAFLPSFAKATQKSSFTMQIFFRFLLTIFILSLCVVLFDTFFTKLIAFGFDKETIELAAPLVSINFWYLSFVFIVTFFGSLLQYKGIFWASAYSPALLNVAMIGALIISRGLELESVVYYLSYGVLIGGFLQILIHIYPLIRSKSYRLFSVGFLEIFRKKDRSKDSIKRFNRSFFPAVVGGSTAQISAFIDTFLASFLISGSISYLYYANRIFQLPLALFAIATATALFPTITRAIKNSNKDRAHYLFKRGFWFLTYLLLFSAIGGIILKEEIIWLLFERGAFEREDTINTSLVLGAYLVGLVPFGLAKLFSLWLYAHHRQLEAAKISIVALSANIIFSLLLIYPYGVFGLAIAGSIGGFVLFFLTIRSFGFIAFFDIIKSWHIAILVVAALLEIAILLYFKSFITIYLALDL